MATLHLDGRCALSLQFLGTDISAQGQVFAISCVGRFFALGQSRLERGLLQRVAGEVAQGSLYTLGGSPREWTLAAMFWRVKVERFDVDSPGSLSVKWAASGVT